MEEINIFYINSVKNLVEEYIFEEDLFKEIKLNFRYYLFWSNIKDNMVFEMNMNVMFNNEL